MKRRHFLLAPLSLFSVPLASAASPPWSARLLQGGFDGTAWNAGLAITLDKNWKTYWRVPGDGGIAPSFKLAGENIKSSRFDYPAPKRFHDEAGMTIGYKNEVVFPFAVEPLDALKPVSVSIETFFGVCDVVCIPAQFNGVLGFDPAKADAADQATISQWKKQVPVAKPQGVAAATIEPITKATAIMQGNDVVLVVYFTETFVDVFIEGESKHYFGAPLLALGTAALKVSGAKSSDELMSSVLRVTLVSENAALEQMVTVV
jgi:DsbC/DsbD-like thiol-disulfide interchange protein